ncbi:kinase-like protein, partial [Marasmius fiardii PR-910]
STTLKAMVRLSERSGLVPQCLMIENVKLSSDIPVGEGAFGDVWKGKIGPQTVCLKITRVYRKSDVQKLLKGYMREAIVWQQTTHPNVLPFMGMYYLDKAHTKICLVSPWMEQGNLHDYLENKPREQVDHYSLVYDVASGLSYLHKNNIVHGDLKGVNVLITPEERACIGDFGLSRVADTFARGFTSSKKTHISGTLRWLSPEILDSDPPSPTSKYSDIYAFAGVCYEIFTGKVPFHELNEGAVIVTVIIHKNHPPRPKLTSLSDTMWNIMVDCWKTEPAQRPTASKVLACVAELNSLKTNDKINPASDWDGFNQIQILKNVEHHPIDTEQLVQLQKDLKSSTNIASAASSTATSPSPDTPTAH